MRYATAVGKVAGASVLVTLAAMSPSAGSAGMHRSVVAEALPVFSLADQTAAVNAVCGPVERSTAIDDIVRPADTVTGFLSADKSTFWMELLSVTYLESGTPRHMVVFGGHGFENDTIDTGEATQTRVAAGLLEYRRDGWRLVARDPALAETGFNGRNPHVALQDVGENRHVIEVGEGLWDRGSGLSMATLYEPVGSGFRQLLRVAESADDCGTKDPCFTFKGMLVYDPKSNPAGFDLRLLLKGTYRNANGKVVRVPAEPLVFKWANGAYAPVLRNAGLRGLWEAVKSPW
jgi:hypothetical protein